MTDTERMRVDLIRAWEALHKGHQTMSDEGLEKDRMRPADIAAYNELHGWQLRTDLGVSALESRAGQYMRRLRRLAHRSR